MNSKMKTLRRNLANDLHGLWIEEHEDMQGFILRDAPDGTAMYTAYVSENGYSSYYGVADDKGYDLADERPLAENVTSVFTAVARIKSHQIKNGDSSYNGPKELWQGAAEELCPFWLGFRGLP